MTDELISLNEAKKRGITKVRMPIWANKKDHIEFHIDKETGAFGPWAKLWSPVNEVIGAENPQTFIVTMMGDLDMEIWQPYVEEEKPNG